MALVSYIRVTKEQKLLLLGIIEEGESRRYTISEELYSSLGSPEARTELSDSDLREIKYADELYRAEKKALSLLSYADNNERTLRQKLARAGFSADVSREICEKMLSLGYINERRQLERLILAEANGKLRGPAKITAHLVSKGYSQKDIREVLTSLADSGEIDFKVNAKRLIDKKLSEDCDAEEKKSLLYRNGYKI